MVYRPPARAEGGERSFPARLKERVLDPTVLAGPPTAAALCLLRLAGVTAAVPYWVIVLSVLGAQAASLVAAALWGGVPSGWRLVTYATVVQGVIAVVVYVTGWGPILAIGFVFGAAYLLETAGSAVRTPALVMSLLAMGVGELLIAVGVAPSVVSKPLVHGLSVLVLLGVAFTIVLLGRWTVAREQAAETVRQSAQRFEALVKNAADIIVVTDEMGTASYVSPAFRRVLGDVADMSHQPASALLHPDDLVRLRREAPAHLAGTDGEWQVDLRLRAADGTWRWFEASVANRLEDPDVAGIVANLHDITARKDAEDLLREAHERFRSAFENAPIGMAMAGVDGRILDANPSYGAILGRSAAELVGMAIDELTHPEDRATSRARMRSVVTGGLDSYQLEKRYLHADGHIVWASVHVSCVRDLDGRPLYMIGQIEDVTEQRNLREQLADAAIYDRLTGLANRVLCVDRLETSLRRSARNHEPVAVAFLDLDAFKLVNDSMGHDAGDRLLEVVAQRLQATVRPGDCVARFGGDEFVVVCDGVADETVAVELAERLSAAIAEPVALAEGEVFVTASVGLTFSAAGEGSAAELLRDADTAMYLAKDRGRSRIEVFDPQNHAQAFERMALRNELHRAVERAELDVYYQPIVALDGRRLVGVEALLRWRHPERGLLAPGQFLAVAEESGLIVPMGAWVLEQACRQALSWELERRANGVLDPPVTVNVNVSPRQLAARGFVDQVAAVLETTGIDPQVVSLEITEGALVGDPATALEVLGRLEALGLRLTIDDFGSGYASFGYLKRFPVSTLKIDRSFVESVDRSSDDQAIVGSVLGLARSLGLSCIAEGVERPRQVAQLRRLGCELAQGYLFGVPQPAELLSPAVVAGAAGRPVRPTRRPTAEPTAEVGR